MGADAFVAFYGVKIELDPKDEALLDACGAQTDRRCVAVKQAGLKTHYGRMTDGDDYFLFVGLPVARIGLEYDTHAAVAPDSLLDIMNRVKAALPQAGFSQRPALHFQFEGQY
jgi:hypothetical protein